jgi:hypothetical protein
MAPRKTEVDVWLTEDGSVLAVGRPLEGGPVQIKATPVAREGQTVKRVEVDLDQIEGAENIRLNADSGELESY